MTRAAVHRRPCGVPTSRATLEMVPFWRKSLGTSFWSMAVMAEAVAQPAMMMKKHRSIMIVDLRYSCWLVPMLMASCHEYISSACVRLLCF